MAKGKMTTEEKLAQALKMVEKYTAELEALRIRDNIEQGDVVTFGYGRGDNARTLTGVVQGVKDDNNGRWVKVQVGEGFDVEVLTIRTAAIQKNPAADKRIAAEAPAGGGKSVPSKAPADPLDPLTAE